MAVTAQGQARVARPLSDGAGESTGVAASSDPYGGPYRVNTVPTNEFPTDEFPTDVAQTNAIQENRGRSTLICRNVTVDGHRTSLRLERLMWEALGEICRREGASRAEICSRVDARRRESSLTAALRVFILSYFRAAATEQGHADAGHGRLIG